MLVIKSFLLTIICILKEYALFAVLFSALVLYIRHRCGRKNAIGSFFFYIFAALIYGATIFDRIGMEHVITKDFMGVKQWFENPWYIVSFLENIVMFIPFGILYVLSFGAIKSSRQCLKWSAIISLSIECLQGIFQLGEAQIVDILANICGAWLGWLIVNKYKIYQENKKCTK